MSRLARAGTAVLVVLLAGLVLATPAAAAPGDRSCLKNRAGSEVCGTEIDADGNGTTDGLDLDGDGRWDVADTSGDGITDSTQGTVTNPETNSECDALEVGCAVRSVARQAASDALDEVAEGVSDAVGEAVKSLGTVWVKIGTPSLTEDGASGWLRSELAFYTGLMAVISVFIGAATMAIQRRSQPAKDLAKSLVTLVVVNSVLVVSLAGLVTGGDAFATYIIDQSTAGTDFGQNITGMLALSGIVPLGSILVILAGLGALLASVVQIMLMVARGGFLVLVAGLLPLASSFTNTAVGRHWHQKMIGWTIAALLYKPAAAIIYAVAFRLTGSDVFGDDGLTSVLAGLLLMIMALLALPALMALAVPAVAATANRSGGGSGGALAAGAVATGAQVIQLKSSTGSGAGGGPSRSGPAGASAPTGGPTGAQPGPSGSRGVPGGSGAAGAKGATSAAAGATAGVTGAAVSVGQAAVGKVRETAGAAASGPTEGHQ